MVGAKNCFLVWIDGPYTCIPVAQIVRQSGIIFHWLWWVPLCSLIFIRDGNALNMQCKVLAMKIDVMNVRIKIFCPSKNGIWCYQGGFLLVKEVELFPSLKEEIRLPSTTDLFLERWNHWHHHNARSLLLTAHQIIDLPLKLDGGQLSLSLGVIDYVTSALTT